MEIDGVFFVKMATQDDPNAKNVTLHVPLHFNHANSNEKVEVHYN